MRGEYLETSAFCFITLESKFNIVTGLLAITLVDKTDEFTFRAEGAGRVVYEVRIEYTYGEILPQVRITRFYIGVYQFLYRVFCGILP